MSSYMDEQKRRAVDMVEECGGSVTRAMRKLGYPTHQTLYHWLNRRDASHERRVGMTGKDVAEMLGVSSAALVYNWARAAEDPRPAAADRSLMELMRDSDSPLYLGHV